MTVCWLSVVPVVACIDCFADADMLQEYAFTQRVMHLLSTGVRRCIKKIVDHSGAAGLVLYCSLQQLHCDCLLQTYGSVYHVEGEVVVLRDNVGHLFDCCLHWVCPSTTDPHAVSALCLGLVCRKFVAW